YIKVDYGESWRVISPNISTRVSISRIHPVTVTEVNIHDKSKLLSFLKSAVSQSRLVWTSAILGELYQTITGIDEPEEGISHHPQVSERLAVQFLHAWWVSGDSDTSDAPQLDWEDYPELG